jgi:hypothetical protein
MKYLYFFSLTLLIPILGFAQTKEVKPKGIKLSVNSVQDFSISLDFELEMNDDTIDFDYWITNPIEKPKLSLQYADQKSKCKLEVNPEISQNSLGFKITGFSESTFDRFLNKDRDNQITLVVENNIKIRLQKKEGESEPQFWIISADIINKMINEDLKFTQDERSTFLTSLNNFYYYENKVDFGVKPGQDSLRTDYVLSIRLQNAYNRKNILKCNEGAKKSSPLYWSLDTRLSTNFNDSLNYIKFYPVNFLVENFSSKIPYQFNVKFGHESNQSFINKRVVIDASINLITPNIINLTTTQSNRLRLKPVISAGLKGYYDYSNNINSFASGLAHIDGYYYIPVFNNYAIIFEGTTFYDFSGERNPNKKIQGNYSITLGAEIPKTGFKAMFKYTDGKTDINFKQGSIISIGLLMDFFQEQKK